MSKAFIGLLASGAIFLVVVLLALLAYLYFNTDTEYAPGYTRRGFGAISIGMSKDEVVSLVGNPLSTSMITFEPERYKDGSVEIWRFSKQGENKQANYFGRYVYFGKDSRVVNKKMEFYVD